MRSLAWSQCSPPLRRRDAIFHTEFVSVTYATFATPRQRVDCFARDDAAMRLRQQQYAASPQARACC